MGDKMKNILIAGVSVLLIAAVPSAGLASTKDAATYFASGLAAAEILQQRKDVDEVSRPQPPSGPATPVPYCSPGSPICP
jgi:hypothetical protein